MQPDTLATLQRALSIDPRRWPGRDRKYHADCPFCGKPAQKGQTHFSLFAWKDTLAYKCWVCGEGGGLSKLQKHLRMPITRTNVPVASPVPRKQANWTQDPEPYVSRFCGHPMTVRLWQSYKPLSMQSIARWRLGVGYLPASKAEHPRLIVPVFEQGRCVALHGRAYLSEDIRAKWLTSGSSRKDVLFNGDLIQPGRMLVVCENLIDTILLMQHNPAWVAVAAGGVSWRDAFTAMIAEQSPAGVLVWMDHDDAGRRARDEIMQSLTRAGVAATAYQWKPGTPDKTDLADYLKGAA